MKLLLIMLINSLLSAQTSAEVLAVHKQLTEEQLKEEDREKQYTFYLDTTANTALKLFLKRTAYNKQYQPHHKRGGSKFI